MEFRMYQYRLYPSKKQKELLFDNFNICKEIYNELLELCLNTYKSSGKIMKSFDFNNYLAGKHKEIYSQVKQNVSDRVYKSFQNFFRKIKEPTCKKKGFPRFKSHTRSITFPKYGFKFISQRRLYVSTIGNIPIVLHRIPKGKVKTMTIKMNKSCQWFAIFSCEFDIKPIQHQSKEKVGIDVGIKHFATISNGKIIDNPKYAKKVDVKLKRMQRRIKRKVKGSKNRKKAILLLALQHNKVTNQRNDFLQKLSRKIVEQYGFIVVEELNIKRMLNNHLLAKQINDASWNEFIKMMEYKAVTSGSTFIKINPMNTSKTCSKCGTIVEMSLEQRQFRCPNCGFICHRDINASINILKVGMGYPEPNACGHDVRPTNKKAILNEAGTICDDTFKIP